MSSLRNRDEYLLTTQFGSTFYTPNQKSIYGYDDISRLTSATNEMGTVTFGHDNRNRIENTTDVFGHTISGKGNTKFIHDGSMFLLMTTPAHC